MKPTDGQCFNCASKKHSKSECPYPKVKPDANKGGGRVDQSDDDAEQVKWAEWAAS